MNDQTDDQLWAEQTWAEALPLLADPATPAAERSRAASIAAEVIGELFPDLPDSEDFIFDDSAEGNWTTEQTLESVAKKWEEWPSRHTAEYGF